LGGSDTTVFSNEARLAEPIYIATKYPAIVDGAYLARAKKHFRSHGDSWMTDLIAQFETRFN